MNSFSNTLQQWYADNGRDLPWRSTRDPYHIWVSEIILQQTRVVQGHDYYARFLIAFPTVHDLAAAPADAVMRQWEGLGYYSRARNMHKAAKAIVEAGAFPTDYADVRALPGIGDYTAAAICSFAYGTPKAVVDGNVLRVLSRYFGMDIPIDNTRGRREYTALADALLDSNNPAIHNQAIMDFGALVCTPRNASCADCPLASSCVAYAEGKVGQLPVKQGKVAVRERRMTYALILHNENLWMHRRPEGDIWAGLYEPVLIADTDGKSLLIPDTDDMPVLITDRDAAANAAMRTSDMCGLDGCGLCTKAQLSGVRHQLTHRTLVIDAFLLEPEGTADDAANCRHLDALEKALILRNYRPVQVSDLDHYAKPKIVNTLIDKLLGDNRVL